MVIKRRLTPPWRMFVTADDAGNDFRPRRLTITGYGYWTPTLAFPTSCANLTAKISSLRNGVGLCAMTSLCR